MHYKASIHDSRELPLQVYAESILALQHKAHEGGSSNLLPLVIMTSDDTHQRTQQLLESHSFFGLSPKQVHLLKQEKVRSTLWAQAGCTAGRRQLRHLQDCPLPQTWLPGAKHARYTTAAVEVNLLAFTASSAQDIMQSMTSETKASEGQLVAPGLCMCMPGQEPGRL